MNLSPEQLQSRQQQLEADARMIRTAAARRSTGAAQPMVKVQVTKKGDGMIATGEMDLDTFDNLYHSRGEVLSVPLATAQRHEDVGYAEIVEEPEAALEGADVVVASAPERRGPGRPPKVV